MLWRKALTYWRSILVACAIAYGCLLRKPLYTLPPIEHGDRWAHWLAFMVLALVLQWDSKIAGLNNGPRWLVVALLPILYGGLIEVIQEKYFYPRTGDWMDWVADVVGVVFGIGLWWIGEKIYERRMGK